MATDEVDSFLRGVASAPALRPPPRVGERLGDRYVIEAFLGEGGMGSVFRALDERLGEQVALKIVKGALDDSILRDEVRLAQKVTHPNVCRTFDLEDIDGRQIVKMEYIAGETLAKRLTAGRLPIADAIRIARAVASGLAAAHAKGIVHSDLKPGNIMLEGDRVVLMDFGVAHLAASPNEGVHGTLGYIAPEKLREHSGDARSDDYALGCVLYEMLAGETVFAGSAITVAALHVGEDPPDVRAKRPEVPRWLARAVSKLLAKDPSDRAVGMRRLVAGPRSPMRVVVPAIVLVAALALGWKATRHPWTPVVWDPSDKVDENFTRAEFSPDGAWLLFDSDRKPDDRPSFNARLYLMSLQTGHAVPLDLPDFKGAGFPHFTRDGHAITFSAATRSGDADGSWRQAIEGSPPKAVGKATFITDGFEARECGDGYVFLRKASGIWQLWSIDSHGIEKLLFRADGFKLLSRAECDPASRRVLFAMGSRSSIDNYMIDRDSGEPTRITYDGRSISDPTFSADGKSLITGRVVDGRKQIVETAIDGGRSRQLTFDEGPNTMPSVSADGRQLAYTRDHTWYPPTEYVDGRWRDITNDQATFVFPRSVSRDQIVVTRGDVGVEVVLVSIATGDQTVLAAGEKPFPSSDHEAIYFVDGRDEHWLESVTIATKQKTRIAWLPGAICYGTAGPDGVHLVIDSGGEFFGYLVENNGRITSEHTHGLVTVAPDGGWRAITAYMPTTTVSLVPPGATLDHPSRTFEVQSHYNRWLDNSHLAYCTNNQCFELDVSTGIATRVPNTADDVGGPQTIETDDHRLIARGFHGGPATMHVITNFGDR